MNECSDRPPWLIRDLGMQPEDFAGVVRRGDLRGPLAGDFRYSTYKMSDYGRMRTLANRMEGWLSYGRLIGSHNRYAFSGNRPRHSQPSQSSGDLSGVLPKHVAVLITPDGEAVGRERQPPVGHAR